MFLLTASSSQASNAVSREPSLIAPHLTLVGEHEGDTDEEERGLIPFLAAPPQEDSFGLSGIGGQDDFVLDTQHDHVDESSEATLAAPPIPSFKLPDPAPVGA
jgi:hypothetical protein